VWLLEYRGEGEENRLFDQESLGALAQEDGIAVLLKADMVGMPLGGRECQLTSESLVHQTGLQAL
jgi:hypothetical protein